MAEYDDRGDDYGGDTSYDDPNEYSDFRWDDRYDYEDLDKLISDYDYKLDDLNDEYKKKKKDNTRAEVQKEIDEYNNRKRFLENLRKYRERWNPKPSQKEIIKSQIKILEKQIKDTTSSLNRCRKQESIDERNKKIELLTKTVSFYKKSFTISGKSQQKSSSTPFRSKFSRPKRMGTKPVPTEERIPLPDESSWGAAGVLKSAFSYGWWGTKSVVKGTAGAVQGVASASVAVGNVAIEGGKLAAEGGKLAAEKGSSLYSTFRENIASQEKVEEQHQQIDQETERKNKAVVKNVEKVIPTVDSDFYETPVLDLKTHVTNLAIEKNNLEGEKRKEEVRRQENEKLCQEEEAKRVAETKRREAEEKLRKEEEEKRKLNENNLRKKLTNLGIGLSENEKIRMEEEDIRQEQENNRQLNENERQMKEDTRQTFENLRQEDEKIRQTLDNNRKIYWEVMLSEKEKWLEKMGHNNDVFQKLMDALVEDDKRRQAFDKNLNDNEDKRIGNETIRLENEKDRREAEEQRVENEKVRIENEKARVEAELKRVTGETKREEQEQNRIDQEEKRFANEDERMANEKARIGREKIAIASEKERIDNEKKRQNFYKSKLEPIPEEEKGRVEAEKGRKEREKIFQENEKQRVQNEKIRISNDERRKFIQEQNLKLLEERANKLDNLEMSFSKKQRIEEKQPKKTFETYFTNEENSTEWIEDERLKKKVKDILENIDKEEAEKQPQIYSNALLDGIEQMQNVNLTAEWEKKIFLDEREKLKWRQRINILNIAFLDKNIVLTDSDPNIIDFLRKNLKDSETIKTKELNGFFYEDKKIVKRNVKKQFIAIEGDHLNNFLEELKKLNVTAETVISNEIGIFADSVMNKEFAESYIREMREEQKQMIKNGTLENGEFFEMEDFNKIGEEVEDIRKNKKFKIRPKIWARSFGGFVSRFVKYLKIIFKRHSLKIIIGLTVTAFGSTSSFLIFRDFLEKVSSKIKDFENKFPKNIKEYFTKDLPEILKKWLGDYYGYYFGAFISMILYFGRSIIFGFTKSVVTLSADIFGMMGRLTCAIFTGLGILAYYPATKALDYVGYYSYKWYEESFYMRNEMPPDDVIERRAEDENIPKEKYKKENTTPNRFYNSNFAKVASYPISAATFSSGKMADEGKGVIDWMANWGIAIGVLGGIIIIVELLIKWRK